MRERIPLIREHNPQPIPQKTVIPIVEAETREAEPHKQEGAVSKIEPKTMPKPPKDVTTQVATILGPITAQKKNATTTRSIRIPTAQLCSLWRKDEVAVLVRTLD